MLSKGGYGCVSELLIAILNLNAKPKAVAEAALGFEECRFPSDENW
jgi:hypothetical protein